MSSIDILRQILVDFQNIQVFRGASTVQVSRMQRDYDQLNIIREGVAIVEHAGETTVVGPGEVVYFPGGFERTEWNDPARPLVCVALLFFRRSELPALPLCVADQGGRLALLADWLLDWATLPDRPNSLMRNTMTAAILAEYIRLSHVTSSRDTAFRREVMQVIAASFRQPDLCLDDLASEVGLTREYLVRRFHAAAGQPPMAALRDYRLDHAMTLLRTTDMTVDQIAWRVGLKGQSRLSRLLRRHRQISPRELRQQTASALLPHRPWSPP